MVQSSVATVPAWLKEVDAERRPAATKLRKLCREQLDGWDERMQWGMPGYGPPGEDAQVSFNVQVRHVALYVGQGALTAFKARLKGADLGKGCLRYAKPDAIDYALVADLLKHVRTHGRKDC